ncbi:RidA family protein [Faunimonas sp. B44]|uniref:RidA family protein n=1 Tax=Faunimonas sp. B44 TaxID=3461493 RepID=UPI004044F05A
MTDIQRLPGTSRMSSAVIHNGTVYLKGVTARGCPAEIGAQTKNVLDQIDALLKEVGSTRDRILQMTVWLSDMAHFDAMNAVYDGWVVAGSEPVRACVQAKLAAPDLLVEMRAIAAL